MKFCACGELLQIKISTIIYSNLLEIKNVPIYSCEHCFHSELFPELKPELLDLIRQLSKTKGKKYIALNEMNEYAQLMLQLYEQQVEDFTSIHVKWYERMDELLDLYLLAQSLGDHLWCENILCRLEQISKHRLFT